MGRVSSIDNAYILDKKPQFLSICLVSIFFPFGKRKFLLERLDGGYQSTLSLDTSR